MAMREQARLQHERMASVGGAAEADPALAGSPGGES
jgi:hypothetical protein